MPPRRSSAGPRALALVLAALTAGCDPPPLPRRGAHALAAAAVSPRRGAPGGPPSSPAPAHVVPPGRGARVIVDVSESNRGFASNSSAALESLHRVLDASLSALELNNPFQRCTLDTDLHCGARSITPAQLRAPGTYSGRFAALHKVLRHAPPAPRADQQADDPLDPYAVTLLVTDGFESTQAPFQPSASEDVACAAGADPSCVAALLRRRVDDGYGVWVIRLVMAFNGRYFSERRLDAAMWQRVQAHVAELNRDPEWTGVPFAVGAPELSRDNGPYQLSGARPLLIFVLSRDLPRARRLVDEVVRRLRVERLTRRQLDTDIAASEWAPFDGLTATVSTATRAENGGAADEVRLDRPTRRDGGLTVPVRCTLDGRARLRLGGVLAAAQLAPPPFARVELTWRAPPGASPALGVPRDAPAPVPGAFTALTTLDCTQLPAGDLGFDLGLWARWTVDDAALATEWFVRESAETSYEMPERVFGLADLGRAVVSAGVLREGMLDRVTVRVHRE